MRVAETIRALRKAYGVGICSVEEICAVAAPTQSQRQGRNLPRQPANGNYSGAKVRDRLRQIIRHHQVDPDLVKISIMMLKCARLPQKLRPASLTSFFPFGRPQGTFPLLGAVSEKRGQLRFTL